MGPCSQWGCGAGKARCARMRWGSPCATSCRPARNTPAGRDMALRRLTIGVLAARLQLAHERRLKRDKADMTYVSGYGRGPRQASATGCRRPGTCAGQGDATVLNSFAVLLAALASFAFGAAWDGGARQALAGRQGSRARRAPLTATARRAPIPRCLSPGPCWPSWSGILLHRARGGLVPSPRTGAIAAAFPWLGFVTSTLEPPTAPSRAPRPRSADRRRARAGRALAPGQPFRRVGAR